MVLYESDIKYINTIFCVSSCFPAVRQIHSLLNSKAEKKKQETGTDKNFCLMEFVSKYWQKNNQKSAFRLAWRIPY